MKKSKPKPARRGKSMQRGRRWQLFSPTGRLFPATLIDTTKGKLAIFRVKRARMDRNFG